MFRLAHVSDSAQYGCIGDDCVGTVGRLEHVESLLGPLLNRKFDLIVAQDLLDSQQHAAFLIHVYDLLTPGGQVVFYESNPWNVVLQMRRGILRISRKQDPRGLLSRTRIGLAMKADRTLEMVSASTSTSESMKSRTWPVATAAPAFRAAAGPLGS